MPHIITKQRRHEILVLDVFQHRSNILFAVLLLPRKVAKRLLPETSLLVSIQLTHLNHLLVLLILHVVVHDLLETVGKRDTSAATIHLLSCTGTSGFCPGMQSPDIQTEAKTGLSFTLYITALLL